MADYAARMLAAGARVVGGCCGTTPEHIRAMRAVTGPTPSARAVGRAAAPAVARPDQAPVMRTAAPPTRLARKLAAGEVGVPVGLDPPPGPNTRKPAHGAH